MEDKKILVSKITDFAKNMRKNILDMALVAGANSSHLGGALSIVEILSTLFGSKIKIDNKNNLGFSDRFILSKGHACLAYYAALHEIGYISKEDLKTFEKDGSKLLGHPVMDKNIGIDFSTGSLGMGLSIAIGIALAYKKKNTDSKVFVVLGDGECNEGSIWEAAMAAPNFDINNLCVIVDKNNFQQTGTNTKIMNLKNLGDKWKSFGWNVNEIDGHNVSDILDGLENFKNSKLPTALIANTTKGKGFSFSENNNEFHHTVLSKKLYDEALKELN